MQLEMFPDELIVPSSIGHASVEKIAASSILTKTSGFMKSYDFSLNPYSGCTFGCVYCYAASFARGIDKRNDWGKWVEVKENALALLRKKRAKLKDKVVYMSSVTDPYQPVDQKTKITRALIEEMLSAKAKLVIQTRSPLVTRDIDLLQDFKERVQVNMTVTTDSEIVRKELEPTCSSNSARLRAISEVQEQGVPSCITMTPLLPVENAERFGQTLLETGVKRFIIQPFHPEKGRFVAGTRKGVIELVKQMKWDDEKYAQTRDVLKGMLPQLGEGKDGFKTPI
jgi:DNA repair photolyase